MTRSILGIALAMAAVAGAAHAECPGEPVECVVPWLPEDLEVVRVRLIAADFRKTYGVPPAVPTKPGGGGMFPGAIKVANGLADRFTIGSFNIAIPSVGPPVGMPDLNSEPFVARANFLTDPIVTAAGSCASYSTMEELAALAQRNVVVWGRFGGPMVPAQATKDPAKQIGSSFAADAAFDALDCNRLTTGHGQVINTALIPPADTGAAA